MSHKSAKIRSSLSFNGPDGVLDIDHIIQSDPWRNIEQFEKSEVGCIQNVLNEFSDKIRTDKHARKSETTKIDPAMADSHEGVLNKSRIPRPQSKSIKVKKEEPERGISRNKKSQMTATKEVKNKFSNQKQTHTVVKQERRRRVNRSEKIVDRCAEDVKRVKKIDKDEIKSKVKNKEPGNLFSGQNSKTEGRKVASESQECRTKKDNAEDSAKPPNKIDRRKMRHSACLEDATNTAKKAVKFHTQKQLIKETHAGTVVKNRANKIINKKQGLDEMVNENLNLDFHTSTPEMESQQIKVPLAKQPANKKKARNSLIKRNSIISSNVPSEQMAALICPKKEPPEDFTWTNLPQSEIQEDKNSNAPVRLMEKPCPIKNIEKPTTQVAKNKIKLPKVHDNASKLNNPPRNIVRPQATEITGKEMSKGYEKRLLEKEEKARNKSIQRHEKRAAKAMQKFSYHVVKIARDMGYFAACQRNRRAFHPTLTARTPVRVLTHSATARTPALAIAMISPSSPSAPVPAVIFPRPTQTRTWISQADQTNLSLITIFVNIFILLFVYDCACN